MRPLARLHAEGADEERMRQPLKQARLGGERAPGAGVAGLLRSEQLRHHERAQPLVPRQPGLIAMAAAQEADGLPAGSDLVALGESPGVHSRRRGSAPPMRPP